MSHHLAEVFQPGPLPHGLFLFSCVGGKEIIVSKGSIPPFSSSSGVLIPEDVKLNCRKIAGGPLKPLSWYHLVLEWASPNESKFVLVMDLKGYKPTLPFHRRIASICTTTKRTIRRFRVFKGCYFPFKKK